MQDLTSKGRAIVDDLARQEDVSADAVTTLLSALRRSGGGQAQFNHPDLGGMGQWSRGGMTMIGDMFNQSLKARVDRLCGELAKVAGDETLFNPVQGSAEAKPAGANGARDADRATAVLGRPSSTGSQNGMHYAVFPAAHRLTVERDGKVTVYDTGDHRIGGAAQQQGGGQLLSFTSQHGEVRLTDLTVVDGDAPEVQTRRFHAEQTHVQAHVQAHAPPAGPVDGAAPVTAPDRATGDDVDVLDKIERLAELHRKGVLTDEEFSSKKTELLGRI